MEPLRYDINIYTYALFGSTITASIYIAHINATVLGREVDDGGGVGEGEGTTVSWVEDDA